MRHCLIIAALLLCLGLADQIPEVKTSISYTSLRDLELKVLKPLALKYIKNITIPIKDIEQTIVFTDNKSQKIPVLGELHIKASKLVVDEFGLDWESTTLRPFQKTSTDTVYLDLERLSVNISLDLFVQRGAKQILLNSRTHIQIYNLTQTLQVQFRETNNDPSWGFVPVIIDSTTNLETLKVRFDSSKLPIAIVNTIIDLIIPFAPKIARGIFVNKLGPLISNLANTTQISIILPQILNIKDTYKLTLSTTQAPYSVIGAKQSALNIALNIDLVNTVTGKVCPLFNEGTLFDRLYANYPDTELILGDNFVNQLLWFVTDSNLINLTIAKENIPAGTLPLVLTTTGLKIITPAFARVYGENQNMYINVQTTAENPQFYFRSGRLVGTITARLSFIVDTANQGKSTPIDQCTTCQVAHTADASLSLMLTAYNPNNEPKTIAATLMEIYINSMEQIGDSVVDLDDANVAQILNSLLNAFVPTINEALHAGFKVPDSILGIPLPVQELDLVLGDSFLVAALIFNQ